MIEPPSHVTEPEHQELWHAACQLLQHNMGLISAGENRDFRKVSEKSDEGWQNSVRATRERQPSERLQGAQGLP